MFRPVREDVRYRGQFLTVVGATFATDDGDEIEREFLRHTGAVAVVPVVGDEVVLVRQFRAAVGRDLLEIPAGLLDVDGEDRETAVCRELEEEAGLRNVGELELLTSYFPTAGMADHRVWIYLARETEACDARPASLEEQHMTIEHVPLSEARALIASGEIADGKTIIGLLLALDRVLGTEA
jgi:8-oxo-dGTP pyrophosphatase MutT (NUDIX family)